ncbi:MAG: glucosaminidase domain-containing protein [Chitinophagales bacterium]
MRRYLHFLFFVWPAVPAFASGQSEAVLNYIDTYKWIAISQMQDYKIPASITLAQGILESGAGLSELAAKSNNHFGIKCHSDWKGDKVYYDDDAKDECFRKYKNAEDSYKDHSEFLTNSNRYSELFELDITDYKGWAKGLKSAGYATNPKYAELLIDLIEKYELHQYDNGQYAESKKKKGEKKSSKNKTDTEPETDDQYFSWNGYKEKVFYFNRIPTVITGENDTPESIAKEHQIKVSNLLKYNDLKPGEDIEAGRNFYLQPKRKKGSTKFHEVKQGETMASISRDEGILLQELYRRNKITQGEEPVTGEKLYLRGTRREPPKTQKANKLQDVASKKNDIIIIEEVDEADVPVTEQDIKAVTGNIDTVSVSEDEVSLPKQIEIISKPVFHTVQAKETLYALSKKYNVKVEEIQQWNQLGGNEIRIGQQLIVGYSFE